jgi:predicted transposase/invertase (TIGR01784 family)
MVLSVKNDLLFKRSMANAAYPEVTKHFIEDVLGFEVAAITIENPYSIEEFENAQGDPSLRSTEVDVLVRLADQSLVTVELQCQNQDFYIQRSAFYVASRFIGDYGRLEFQQTLRDAGAEKYSSLYPVYGINLVDFCLFAEDDRCYHHFTFIDADSHELLRCDGLLHLCYIELGKKPPRHLRHWVDFFNDLPCAADAPDYIRQAYELVDFANLSVKEQQMISAAELREQDYIGQMRYAKRVAMAEGRAEGEAQGRAEGEARGRLSTARNLLELGVSVEVIQKATGLTPEEIDALRQ